MPHCQTIHNRQVHGLNIGALTECTHWHSALDIVAIKFPCCDTYYACHDCHLALADHPPMARSRERFEEACILCGACGAELTATEYLGCNNTCPHCTAAFNPGCANHYDLYFDK